MNSRFCGMMRVEGPPMDEVARAKSQGGSVTFTLANGDEITLGKLRPYIPYAAGEPDGDLEGIRMDAVGGQEFGIKSVDGEHRYDLILSQ